MTRKASKGRKLTTHAADLLPGEKISFSAVVQPRRATDEELNRRYVKGEVRIVTESARYPLAGILAMLDEKIDVGGSQVPRYKLDPEYQRRHRWSQARKSRLIESFLINVPVPPVFLYEQDLARFEVMDGRQRLMTLRQFYNNEFELVGLQYWQDLDGKTYATLPSKVRDGIDRRYISSIILLKETASDEEQAAQLKKMVFERLNSGGVKLSPQETRNAISDGPLNQLCLELSKNAQFCAMWGIPSEPPPERDEDEEDQDLDEATNSGRRMFAEMGDVELVLRFFAYRQIDTSRSGLNKISEFLDKFLIAGNKFPQHIHERYKSIFEQTIAFLSATLGAQAFCRLAGDGRPRPTRIVYDPVMWVASRYANRPDRVRLEKMGTALRARLTAMYDQHSELFGGRRTNSSDVQQRNECMQAAFRDALGEPEV